MTNPEFTTLGQLLQCVCKEQRMVILFNEEPIPPEETFKHVDKYVVDVRALQYPEGDVGLGITLSDTIIYMPIIVGPFGGDE
ncbi:MAG: hypothetical protein NC548_60300 [Lachnospiraceae bacterium]|nr:hypothetical protein [Lachnospiraceae bacterium]